MSKLLSPTSFKQHLTVMSEGVPPTSDASARPQRDAGDESVCALTERVVAGDRDAYTALFHHAAPFVEREAVRRLGGRRDLAFDAAQETWLRVARGPRRCEDQRRLEAWLRRLVMSAAMDLLRSELSRRVREDAVARSRGEAVAFLDDVDVFTTLREEVERCAVLESDDRGLLELKARTGATLRQLAEALGIGRATVDSKLRRAAERARAMLQSQEASS